METLSPLSDEDLAPLLQQALSAYQNNQDDDQLSILLEQLGARQMVEPPPDPAEEFNELDSNGDGGLNTSELEAMSAEITSMTGQSIDSEEALTTYDINEGALVRDEVDSMMSDLRAKLGPPPNMKEGGTMADALTAYLEAGDENTLDTLLEILGNYSNSTSDGNTKGVDIDA
ncbi:MAG: hypothetical protein KKD01_09680 [Proteobacteria bacterium]|nr:hypothetical protein [Pseudomonadota bacterium]MBU1420586.1 hypothetical protein [Pseudomonadota bacterium]MBU1454981.1 hypothetical protein [Pseudomonadota bacterium]